MDKNILKIRYDPEIGLYIDKHNDSGELYGEELMKIFELIQNKHFAKIVKKNSSKSSRW